MIAWIMPDTVLVEFQRHGAIFMSMMPPFVLLGYCCRVEVWCADI